MSSIRRYLSTSKRSSSMPDPDAPSYGEKQRDGIAGSTASVVSDDSDVTAVPAYPLNLKIKRVDHYWSRWTKQWKYKNTGDKVKPEKVPLGSPSGNDAWRDYCFVVVRKLPKADELAQEPTYHIVIKSPYLVQACKNVVQEIRGVSWNSEPLQLSPELLIAFLPHFDEYHATLHGKKRTQEESNIMATVGVLVEYLRREYKGTLTTIRKLIAHGEITWDLLYAIMVPRTILVTTCEVTGEPRALRLVSAKCRQCR
ncbi:hypothetical protein NM688_g2058 [Phlebia brevispora]|uniref:Uncharacterized protein n=1 Tax=Phlebia brevispora TaxID=194682 RepID=A0ACC1T9Z0_9APHY|nr:hypothetical protein NM688_g2058 [Phlebia brevispora]